MHVPMYSFLSFEKNNKKTEQQDALIESDKVWVTEYSYKIFREMFRMNLKLTAKITGFSSKSLNTDKLQRKGVF